MIPLAAAQALHDAGAKARTLARALVSGLPVLDGFVVLPGEEVDPAELAQELARLGGERFAVRSSATVEDLPGASAAGVFESVVGVDAGGVADAIERVRQGVTRQAAAAYLGARGLLGERLAMAVLVQPMARAPRLGVLRTAPVVDGHYAAEERDAHEPEHGQVAPRRVATDEPLGVSARAMAALVGGDADVEYALGDGGPILLQARPLTAAPPRRDPSRWLPGALGTFVLDEEHNPAPLSAAQTSLVARLERPAGPARQLVLHGWLFLRVDPPTDGGAREGADLVDAGEMLAGDIAPRADAILAPLEALAEPPLAEALAAFDRVAGLHAELRPALRRARRRLDLLLQRSIGEGLAAHGELLAGTGGRTLTRDLSLWVAGRAPDEESRARRLADHLRQHGAFAPAWDVAAPSDEEEPGRVAHAAALVARAESPERRHAEALERAAAAARRLADRLSPALARELAMLLPAARAAMQAAEDDDGLFFRAQRLVRRALLAVGRRAAAEHRLDGPWQIFDLPIEEVEAGALDAGRARGLRALRDAQARLAPPSMIREGVALWHGGGGGSVLVGAGTCGRGYGRALLVRDPATVPAGLVRGAVLVMASVLPSTTWMIAAAAGLVTDAGGALSHAATLAREYGVPAVLGTGSATRTISDGDDLIVDADHGRVYRLGGG